MRVAFGLAAPGLSEGCEVPDARKIDERRTVGDDQHTGGSAPVLRNSFELASEIFDVVVDRVEAVSAGRDQKVVERHVKGSRGASAREMAGAHFIDDEQQSRTLHQLLGRLSGERSWNLDDDIHGVFLQ
jgi:hypothetical protein